MEQAKVINNVENGVDDDNGNVKLLSMTKHSEDTGKSTYPGNQVDKDDKQRESSHGNTHKTVGEMERKRQLDNEKLSKINSGKISDKNAGEDDKKLYSYKDVDSKQHGGNAAISDTKDPMSSDTKPPVAHTWKVPDGGYGWVVVVSALVISLIVDGLSYTFGIFLGDFERAFREPKSKISLASSIQVGLYLFIGPLVSALTNRFGCRPVIIVGSFVASGAFIASSWSTDVTMLILTYGVVGGIGFGLMYLPSIVAVSIYFEEKRAVATGIAVCGSGVGTFILAPLTDFLIYEYNWSWTLLILGALILNGVVFGGLVRPLELQKQEVDESKSNATVNIQREYDGAILHEKAKTGSSNKLPTQEEVPLISDADRNERNASDVSYMIEEKDGPNRNVFSSTPNIHNSGHPLAKVVLKDENLKSSDEQFFTNSAERPRSNTLDMLLHKGRPAPTDTQATNTPPQARAHAPMGLSFISLSDADLDKIRDDVHLPLSRKDIHLSGPLNLAKSDPRIHGEETSQALYVQSLRSVTSLAAKEGLADVKEKPSGIWSCLPDSARETLEQMLSLSILKDMRYWCVLMGNFFCMIGFYVPFVYVPDHAKQLGIEEDKAAFLLSIIGITNTVGRVMTGVVINFLNIDCGLVTGLAIILAGIMTCIYPMCHTYAALIGVSAVFGVCLAAYISLCSVLLCELLGVENLTNAFGFVILFRGVACIIGPPVAGAIFDATGVYDPSFYIGGITIMMGGICHMLLLLPCCRRKKTSTLSKD